MSAIHVRLVLASLVLLPALGCVAASEPGVEPNGAQQEALTANLSNDVDLGKIDDRLAFPPPGAVYCPGPVPPVAQTWDTPQCSRSALPLPSTYDRELVALGCSKPFKEKSLPSSGFIYIVAALCPDNAATQAAAAMHTPYAQHLINWYCSPCVPKAPKGQIYLFLEAPVGPGCPSGCGHTASAF